MFLIQVPILTQNLLSGGATLRILVTFVRAMLLSGLSTSLLGLLALSGRKLSARLHSALDLCGRCNLDNGRFHADIGCDHATLGIKIVQHGYSNKVISIDRCAAPLEAGKRNADAALGAETSSLDFRLGDGCDPLSRMDNVGVISICGMGVRTILDILSKRSPNIDIASELGASHLVLQSVNPR